MATSFSGFSPDSFEQFVRALAIHVFGPGVAAFGDGPDGGREAIFRGAVPYPFPPTTQWSGYGVIQAKFKEKVEPTDEQRKWALSQLSKELELFVSSPRRDPKPEYYVFVTNVELPAGGRGWDEADKLLTSYYGKLPLKGHAIWDGNQLSAFLDSYTELRKSFQAYLTTGDLIAALIAEIQKRHPNAERIMTSYLINELRFEELARLDQAGNKSEQELKIARLFFDLPAFEEQLLVAPHELPDQEGNLPAGIVAEMLISGSRKLDPQTLFDYETNSIVEALLNKIVSRYVIIGGPGSGKSTVGQFLAQIHRAALLDRTPQHLLTLEVRTIIKETRDICNKEGLLWPATPRYPFRIELTRFAKSLASDEADHVETLAQYLLRLMDKENSLTWMDLRDWLAVSPCLFVLDGLDEVPATSNRDRVVKEIEDFLAEARLSGADIFLVSTSRQQGYTNEFANSLSTYRYVAPLSQSRAIRYIERYAQARFGDSEPNRAENLVDALQRATQNKLTAQLMSTPLQVTFMATVVSSSGTPGEDRWQLFSKYYETIYDRERQKAIVVYSDILSNHRAAIDRLHYDIGFWLQYQGETAADSSVSLSINQFERTVERYLDEDGYMGQEKKNLVENIIGAAQLRLVFLTSRVPNELSFEVRSLQEYMAAECIMSGRPEIQFDRLRSIATVPYWRNTLLFAIGKCFGEAQLRHMQDSVRALCEDLNGSVDTLYSIAKSGSDIALDVLQSGAVTRYPLHARHLAKIALASNYPVRVSEFQDGAATIHQRLALVYNDHLSQVYYDDLESRMGQSDIVRTLGAWPLLILLVQQDVTWAKDLAERAWPTEQLAQRRVIDSLLQINFSPKWFLKKLNRYLVKWPEEAKDIVGQNRPIYSVRFNNKSTKFLSALKMVFDRNNSRSEAKLRIGNSAMSWVFTSVDTASDKYEPLEKYSHKCPLPIELLPFAFTLSFLRTPNRHTLGAILSQIAERGWNQEFKSVARPLPWPLAACLQWAKSVDDLKFLANKVEDGELGDIDEWRAAEERWLSVGISIDDLLTDFSDLPFSNAITHEGFPELGDSISLHSGTFSSSDVSALFDAAEKTSSLLLMWQFLWFIQRYAEHQQDFDDAVHPARLRALLEKVSNKDVGFQFTNTLPFPKNKEQIPSWIDFYDWLGRTNHVWPRWSNDESNDESNDLPWVAVWQSAFIADPSRIGLVRLLSRLSVNINSCPKIISDVLTQPTLSEPLFRFSALLITFSQGQFDAKESVALSDEAAAFLTTKSEVGSDFLLMRAIERLVDRAEHIDTASAVLPCLYKVVPAQTQYGQAEYFRLIRLLISRMSSNLHHSSELSTLKLPQIN